MQDTFASGVLWCVNRLAGQAMSADDWLDGRGGMVQSLVNAFVDDCTDLHRDEFLADAPATFVAAVRHQIDELNQSNAEDST